MAVETTNLNRLKEVSVGTGPISSSRFSIMPSALPPLGFQRKTNGSFCSRPVSFTVVLWSPIRHTHVQPRKMCCIQNDPREAPCHSSVRIVFIGNSSKSPQFRFYFIDCVSPSGINLVSGHWINRTEAISVPPCHMKCFLLKISLFLCRFSYVLHLTQLVSFLLQPSTHF